MDEGNCQEDTTTKSVRKSHDLWIGVASLDLNRSETGAHSDRKDQDYKNPLGNRCC